MPQINAQPIFAKNQAMLNIIQHLVMPNLTFGAPENMYARTFNDRVNFVSLSDDKLVFKASGQVQFDTFFNSLSVGVWKKHCKLQDLHLVIQGSGKFLLRCGLNRADHPARTLVQQIIDLQAGEDTVVAINCWQKLVDGMLFFNLLALEDGAITGGYYATTTPPANPVKMGIVITHFNRKQYVLPAIARVREQLLNDPRYQDNISLTVIDNSQNISRDEAQGITLIPNKNLGGSGGFTRGLLHLIDEGSFTHCLFMDDDASCEVESIRRCYHLLQFALTERFAVSGVLMRELEPYRLHEKGGAFGKGGRPLKEGLDLQLVDHLLYAEKEDTKTDYGAWWFFAFNINDVQNLAFPFFVRGDDIQFSMQNDFSICTLNGIGCWGDDFWYKEGPLTRYLSARSNLLLMLIFGKAERSTLLKAISKVFCDSLYSYNYASAKAARLALEHFCLGPQFWIDNMDMGLIRAEIGAFSAPEKLEKINKSGLTIKHPKNPHRKEKKLHKILRNITLNGILLPSFMLKRKIMLQPKHYKASFKDIFLYKNVLYEYAPTGQGYFAVQDKKQFFVEYFAFIRQLFLFAKQYNAIKQDYEKAMQEMTSEAFWRNIYIDQ